MKSIDMSNLLRLRFRNITNTEIPKMADWYKARILSGHNVDVINLLGGHGYISLTLSAALAENHE